MDELSAFKGAPRELRQREAALLAVADLVFTVGPTLFEAKRKLHPNVHYLPSAVDAEHFAPHPDVRHDPQAEQAARLLEGVPHPRLGYFGVIDERLDLALHGGRGGRSAAVAARDGGPGGRHRRGCVAATAQHPLARPAAVCSACRTCWRRGTSA